MQRVVIPPLQYSPVAEAENLNFKQSHVNGDTDNRVLLAAKDMKAGTIALASTGCMVLLDDASITDVYCARCLSPHNLKKCSRCNIVKYCGKDCQKLSWNAHKRVCHKEGIALFADETFDIKDRMEIRMLAEVLAFRKLMDQEFRTITADKNSTLVVSPTFRDVNYLAKKNRAVVPELVRRVHGVPAIGSRWWAKDTVSNGFSKGQGAVFFLSLLRQFHTNNFGVMNSRYQLIGAGFFPLGALLNHSCRPNCILGYAYDPTLQQMIQYIRVLEDVKQGAELTHSYVDGTKPLSHRMRDLKDVYDFVCTCDRCDEEKEFIELRYGLGTLEADHPQVDMMRWLAQYLHSQPHLKVPEQVKLIDGCANKAEFCAAKAVRVDDPMDELMWLKCAMQYWLAEGILRNGEINITLVQAIAASVAIADAHTVQSLSDAIVFCYWYAENIGLTCHKNHPLRGIYKYIATDFAVQKAMHRGTKPTSTWMMPFSLQGDKLQVTKDRISPKECIRRLQAEAVQVLRISHGADDPLVREIEQAMTSE